LYDLTVFTDNIPGALADLGEATGSAGINIEGICGMPFEHKGVFHILLHDPAPAREALEKAGFRVGMDREVLVLRRGVDIVDQPGAAGVVARAMADADVNVELIYVALSGDVVLGTDDLEKAREAQRRAGVPAALAY
jgi:hypothetical protein